MGRESEAAGETHSKHILRLYNLPHLFSPELPRQVTIVETLNEQGVADPERLCEESCALPVWDSFRNVTLDILGAALSGTVVDSCEGVAWFLSRLKFARFESVLLYALYRPIKAQV